MLTLSKLVPVNLEAEKQRFFAENCNYNPRFEYEDNFTREELIANGLPKSELLDLAQKIVKEGVKEQLEADALEKKSELLSQEEVTKKVKAFLKLHDLDERYSITWSSSFVARTSITATNIKLRIPAAFRSHEDLMGMLYHEVGTHALRRVNYEKQPWFKKKKQFGFGSYLKTEEGLASLHSLLPLENKLAYGSALRYLAVAHAQKESFIETYKFVSQYIDDSERRWAVTFKQKRGLFDTSLPGGYTKDLVYFAGLVEVWNYLNKKNFEVDGLYFGKLSKEDVEKAREMNPTFEPLLPNFYTTDKENYRRQMIEIGRVNHLL
jgi:hypothetical protein